MRFLDVESYDIDDCDTNLLSTVLIEEQSALRSDPPTTPSSQFGICAPRGDPGSLA